MSDTILAVGNFYPPIADDLAKRFDVHSVDAWAKFGDVPTSVLESATGLATMGWAPPDVIDALPNLKIISSFGVGYDGVAAVHAADKGVIVAHTPNVLNDEVANTVLALIFATDRRIVAQDRYVREGRWVREGNAPLTRSIAGKTIGILGLGRIGERLAEKLAVFNCHIAYHSRNRKSGVSLDYYKSAEALASASDILVVITPGGPETNKLVDKAVIEALGPDGTLINVSRGSVVDESALVAALLDGRLGAAGLDVFEDEPNVPEALFALDNVVLTPHVGSATIETRQAMADRVVENMMAFFDTGRPINPVPECASLLE